MRKFKITDGMQHAAVTILTSLIFCKTMDEVWETYREMYKRYELKDDPFTHLPCTNKEYSELCEEYSRQSMIERYGYYE